MKYNAVIILEVYDIEAANEDEAYDKACEVISKAQNLKTDYTEIKVFEAEE